MIAPNFSTDLTPATNPLDIIPAAPPAPDGEWNGEKVAGYDVHPYLTKFFPLMEGRELDALVESIDAVGRVEVPIELYDGKLIDGRNRARAVEVLRSRGKNVDLPVTEWTPKPGEFVERRIYNLNAARRHLTPDQSAVICLPLLPGIRAECNARQAETRFGGSRREGSDAAAETSLPPEQGGQQERACSAKTARSSLGALSRLAGTSTHMVRMAVAAATDVEAGLLPPEELEAVARGEKKLSQILRRKKSPKPPASKPSRQRAPVEDFMDSAVDESDDDESNALTLEDFISRWERIKAAYAVTEHRELRAIALRHIADEQRRLDQR